MATDGSGALKTAAFQQPLSNFLAGMEAVEELATFAREHAHPLDDEERVIQQALSSRVKATPEQNMAAYAAVRRMMEGITDALSEKGQASEDASAESPEGVDAAVRPAVEEAIEVIREVSTDTSVMAHYIMVYSKNRARVARLGTLNASLLTSAVSNFEVLISNLIKQFLRERPDALRGDDSKYSLAEVSAYESLEEFRDYAADRYAEGVLRGSFDDWMNWFDKQLKIKLHDVSATSSGLREVFQRRHLFVHNGGRVNRLYLSKLPELKSPPAIDTQLNVDPAYLSSAIDDLTAAGTILTTLIVRKLFTAVDHEHPADSMASDVAYEFLRSARWSVVITLTSALSDACTSDYTRYVMKVNGWIARKRLNGVEAIRSEVDAWQVSALAPRFRLARLALLDRTEEAHDLAQTLLEQNELEQAAWESWPLLQEIRDFAATTRAQSEVKQELQSATAVPHTDTLGATGELNSPQDD
ncbi:hypothetical protein SAMN05660690_2867 [Geodermatophilus telluris]|uniref:Uncharacterized protein n=1 Tax=Geodermatophilus telluris TaxID=1190417 RepID=A0A1G6QE26_9ACTN|nr:hypothetical protein [Geodermatophilus telluris]SDC90730.1 hypothetical protein SAMN05660690_2867 [Geodermatophilus telluris]